MLRQHRAAIPVLLLVLITIYGALLRLDVFVQRYGTLDHPLWAKVVTQDLVPLASRLHPSRYRWYHIDRPYLGGDPINYLRFAREMRGFYQAHVREPIFLALTRLFLWLLSDQDAAVSFASATGSILTILAGYLLASVMLSRAAGLVLSLILAIEYDLISWSVDGWRDDVFMATVTFSAWAFVRCQRGPSLKNGALAGLTSGVACLTRITALSFVLPALFWLAIDGAVATRRSRVTAMVAALIVCAGIVSPYLISCAMATGDPLYAINYHTRYYRHGEGVPFEQPMSAMAYIRSKIGQQPVTALDTAITGLFVQPFATKWRGLDGWLPKLGTTLSGFSIVGLLTWLFLARGRLMLVMLIGSLVPYALTWNVAGGGEWRFTMHVYPLYVLASMSGAAFIWRTAAILWRAPRRVRYVPRQMVIRWAVVCVAILGVTAAYLALPWFVVREKIAAGTDVSLETGGRDTPFYGSGWSRPYVDGLTFRVSTTDRAVVRIPLPTRRQYQIVLRLDPVAADRQHRAVVLLNRQLLATLILNFNPDRVGAYSLVLPADKIRLGMNELTIVPDALVTAGSAGPRFASRDPEERLGVRLWYVRVLGSSPQSRFKPGPLTQTAARSEDAPLAAASRRIKFHQSAPAATRMRAADTSGEMGQEAATEIAALAPSSASPAYTTVT